MWIEDKLIISSDYENETFEYYTASDLNTSSLIADPTKFQNDPFNDSVYVKIITSNNCYRTSQIDIKVGASLISESFMLYYAVCDDSTALNQDGIATFSSDILKEVKQKLVASDSKFSAQTIKVRFYENKEDALTIAYENIKKIKIFEDKNMTIQNQDLVFYREDIGN